MISVNFFYCFEKIFSLLNLWIIGKYSMKQKIFTVTFYMEDITDADYLHAKRVSKNS